jgi:hypothetical protein
VSRAARLVLALYPRPVRERYGAEITDLLAHSRRPVRDLADVARCALAERARDLTYTRMKPHLGATTGLLAAPMTFAGAFLVVYTLGGLVLTGAATLAGVPVTEWSGRILGAAAILSVAAGAVWLARHVRLPYTPALAPTGLAAGTLPLMLLFTASGRAPMAVAVAGWWLVTGAFAGVAVRAARRGRRRRARVVMAVGGVLACEVACAVYAWSLFGSPAVAAGVFPFTALGLDPAVLGESADRAADALTVLPVLLAACTAYTFGLATSPRPGPVTA